MFNERICYDDQLSWIQKARKNGVPWRNINYGNGVDINNLHRFLQWQQMRCFWDEIYAEEWFSIVEKAKRNVKSVDMYCQ